MADESARHQRFAEAFNCTPFYRDSNFSPEIIRRHKVGLFLRERGFCDMTYKSGGFLGNHRYLIISEHAGNIEAFSQTPEWGLCLLRTQSLFKIIGVHEKKGRTQTALLEIPDEFIRYFANEKPNEIEIAFAGHAEKDFHQSLDLPPLPELNNPGWLERLEWPLGMNEKGEYFPLFDDPQTIPASEIEHVAISLAYLARVHLANGNVTDANRVLRLETEIRSRLP